MKRGFAEAVATLVGTTIGAGMLGIPYVVAQAGLAVGLLHIIIIGAAVMLLNLLLGEVVLRTKGSHQLTGYAEKYLGKAGKRLMALVMIFGIYGAMVAYIIGAGDAINAILPGITPAAGSIIFFATLITVLYAGLKAVEKSELILATITVIVVAILIAVALGSGKFSAANFTQPSMPNFFLPYGVVLFAFLGAVAIPEMKEELGRQSPRRQRSTGPRRNSDVGKLLRAAIIVGGLVPLLAYTLFAVAVVGVTGASTGQIATISLGAELGRGALVFANIFAILAMGTSFIALGLALKEMYRYDYGIDGKDAWSIACGAPLIAFLFGIKDFIAVLGTAGAIAGGIEGILIVAMHARAGRSGKPEYTVRLSRIAAAALLAMFAAGVIYAAARLV